MTSRQIQLMIVGALRWGERLDHFEIAKRIDQAPFRVRGELRALKRARCVHERLTVDEHSWRLTPRGERLAWSQEQQELQP